MIYKSFLFIMLSWGLFKYNKYIEAISIIIAVFDILWSSYKMSKEAETMTIIFSKENKFPVDHVTRVYNKDFFIIFSLELYLVIILFKNKVILETL